MPASTYRRASHLNAGSNTYIRLGSAFDPLGTIEGRCVAGGNLELRFADSDDERNIYVLVDRGGTNPDLSEAVADGGTSTASATSDDDRFEYFIALTSSPSFGDPNPYSHIDVAVHEDHSGTPGCLVWVEETYGERSF